MDRRQEAYEEEGGGGAEQRRDLVGEDGYHGRHRRLGACAEEPARRRRHFDLPVTTWLGLTKKLWKSRCSNPADSPAKL